MLEPRLAPLARGVRGLSDSARDAHLDRHVASFRVELRLAAEALGLWARVPQAVRGIRSRVVRPAHIVFAGDGGHLHRIQIGLALPMAEYFHRVSFTGLTANLLICPLLEAVVPLGFAAIFTNCHWLAALAGWLLKISGAYRRLACDVRALLAGAGPAAVAGRRAHGFIDRLCRSAQRRAFRTCAGAVVLVLFLLLVWHPWPPEVQPNQFELTAIDVGQGDSLLLLFPEGARMLVDGGGVLEFGRVRKTNLDIGEDVVSPYLWSRGIKTLDVVVATHAHADHIGGLPAILDNFRPKELWVGANATGACGPRTPPGGAGSRLARRNLLLLLRRHGHGHFPAGRLCGADGGE